ncbi:hypothetical protein OGAPHI_003879 [Ogataea philodendri]|uniref:Uncharacterized protein n=1 Tax=Ogataea philodendri TaxID=1378263 RepID=A0A9P8T5A3_9ASCO|nr:uncharacterized protein OGAPHI_003879 [Ogataea philodendri]KAH3665691.1 hypothetical protein OGAPHI_003879 [Ogataea philodendri]
MTLGYPLDYASRADTYYLASKVKAKLTKEAVSHDVNLHRLVCQANLLDNLIDRLNAKEHERGRRVSFENIQDERHVRVVESQKPELTRVDEEYSDSDSDDSDSEEDYEFYEVDDEDDESESFYMNHDINGSTVTITTKSLDLEEEDDMPSLTVSSSESDSESDYDSDHEIEHAHVQHVEHADPSKVEAARNLMSLRRGLIECM